MANCVEAARSSSADLGTLYRPALIDGREAVQVQVLFGGGSMGRDGDRWGWMETREMGMSGWGSMPVGMDDGMDGVIGGAAPYSPITRRLSFATVPTRLPFDRFRLPFLGTSPRANPKPAPASYWPVPKCRAWPPSQANCPLQRTGQMRCQ